LVGTTEAEYLTVLLHAHRYAPVMVKPELKDDAFFAVAFMVTRREYADVSSRLDHDWGIRTVDHAVILSR
jgi:hypothetical protein